MVDFFEAFPTNSFRFGAFENKFSERLKKFLERSNKNFWDRFQIPHEIMFLKPKKKKGGLPLQIEFFWVQMLPGGAVLKCGARVTNDCTDNPAGKADPPGQGANPKSSCPRAPA